jgi:hypothetical protein
MAWKYSTYSELNFGISFGIVILSLIFTGVQFIKRPKAFYSLIKDMFGIEHIPSDCGQQPGTLNLYGEYFQLKKEKEWCSKIPRVCLWITAGVVIGATLIVFIDGLILNVIYLPPKHKCPENDDMDCYSTSRNNTYFLCNSSDVLIPPSLGSVICYKWFKKGFSTLEVLEQIGLCAGLFQVFNWMVMLYLRLLLFMHAFPSQPPFHGYAHPLLAGICTLLSPLIPIVTIGVLVVRSVSVTGLTMAVVSCGLVIVFTMLVLVLTWRRNKRLMADEESLRNTEAPTSIEMTVSTVETQQRSTKICEE